MDLYLVLYHVDSTLSQSLYTCEHVYVVFVLSLSQKIVQCNVGACPTYTSAGKGKGKGKSKGGKGKLKVSGPFSLLSYHSDTHTHKHTHTSTHTHTPTHTHTHTHTHIFYYNCCAIRFFLIF